MNLSLYIGINRSSWGRRISRLSYQDLPEAQTEEIHQNPKIRKPLENVWELNN